MVAGLCMKEEKPKALPKAARYARIAAIAVWPLGILLGLMLSVGQDAAGEGLAFVMGLAFALLASVFFGLVFWFCRSHARVRLVSRFRRALLSIAAIAVAVFLAWYTQPLFEDQQYSLRVKNWTSRDIAEVEIRLAGTTIPIGRIQAGAAISREGLSKRPTGAVTVSWVDDEGAKHTVTEGSTGGPPRRYDGGKLVVNVKSRYDIHTYFSRSR